MRSRDLHASAANAQETRKASAGQRVRSCIMWLGVGRWVQRDDESTRQRVAALPNEYETRIARFPDCLPRVLDGGAYLPFDKQYASLDG